MAAPISHTTDTRRSRARERLRDTASFFRPGTPPETREAILEKYGVSWVVIDKNRGVADDLAVFLASLDRVYEDKRYVLFRTAGSRA